MTPKYWFGCNAFMYQSQNTLAVIFMPIASKYPQVGQALNLAGWAVEEAALGDETVAVTADMIVVDGYGDPPATRRRSIVVAVTPNAKPPLFPTQLTIDPQQDAAQLASQLRAWHIPDVSSLVRMSDLFGRNELAPIVEGLRTELERALSDADEANAHRIAGLSGTLGFAAASASWRSVEDGTGSKSAALRDSRTALIAIDGWLDVVL